MQKRQATGPSDGATLTLAGLAVDPQTALIRTLCKTRTVTALGTTCPPMKAGLWESDIKNQKFAAKPSILEN